MKNLKIEVRELKMRIEVIQKEKVHMEEDFNLKKSKFKDMFYAKES